MYQIELSQQMNQHCLKIEYSVDVFLIKLDKKTKFVFKL